MIEDLCRLCLSPDVLLRNISKEKNLLMVLNILFPPMQIVKGVGLPTGICEQCLLMSNLAFRFKMKCEIVQDRLVKNSEKLHNGELANEVEKLMKEDDNHSLVKYYEAHKPSTAVYGYQKTLVWYWQDDLVEVDPKSLFMKGLEELLISRELPVPPFFKREKCIPWIKFEVQIQPKKEEVVSVVDDDVEIIEVCKNKSTSDVGCNTDSKLMVDVTCGINTTTAEKGCMTDTTKTKETWTNTIPNEMSKVDAAMNMDLSGQSSDVCSYCSNRHKRKPVTAKKRVKSFSVRHRLCLKVKADGPGSPIPAKRLRFDESLLEMVIVGRSIPCTHCRCQQSTLQEHVLHNLRVHCDGKNMDPCKYCISAPRGTDNCVDGINDSFVRDIGVQESKIADNAKNIIGDINNIVRNDNIGNIDIICNDVNINNREIVIDKGDGLVDNVEGVIDSDNGETIIDNANSIIDNDDGLVDENIIVDSCDTIVNDNHVENDDDIIDTVDTFGNEDNIREDSRMGIDNEDNSVVKYKCDVCQKKFPKKRTLNKHKKICFAVCEFCGEKTEDANKLLEHIKYKHYPIMMSGSEEERR